MPTAPGFTRARIGRVLGLVGQVENRWARIDLSPAERKWLQKWSKDAHDTIEQALLRLAGKADPDERSKFLPRDTLSWSNTVPDPAGFLCFPTLEYEGIKRYLEWLFSHSGPESRMFRRPSQLPVFTASRLEVLESDARACGLEGVSFHLAPILVDVALDQIASRLFRFTPQPEETHANFAQQYASWSTTSGWAGLRDKLARATKAMWKKPYAGQYDAYLGLREIWNHTVRYQGAEQTVEDVLDNCLWAVKTESQNVAAREAGRTREGVRGMDALPKLGQLLFEAKSPGLCPEDYKGPNPFPCL
ncbi:hypothetical protein JCM3766R1_000861 [Sporobolomyces carnicolor]